MPPGAFCGLFKKGREFLFPVHLDEHENYRSMNQVLKTRLVADERVFGEGDIREILEFSRPELAGLSLTPVGAGTDNRVYRLGEGLALRIPRTIDASRRLQKEVRWMPRVTQNLPLQCPTVICDFAPTVCGSFRWVVYDWIDGIPGNEDVRLDTAENAIRLAEWIIALRAVDPCAGPGPGKHNFGRGGDLRKRALRIRHLIARHAPMLDAEKALAIWTRALESSEQKFDHRWLHGDLQPSNILTSNGSITGVVDFGGLGVGDTACELLACWTSFGPKGRAAMREVLQPDDAAWHRGRGWALATAIEAFDYYRAMDHPIVSQSENTLRAVLCDSS